MAEARAIEVAVKPHLDAVVVRPGDRLVVRVARLMARDERDELEQRIHEVLPGVTPIFLQADQILVYRDGGPDD